MTAARAGLTLVALGLFYCPSQAAARAAGNGNNSLQTAGRTLYSYDAEGRRVKQQQTSSGQAIHFIYDAFGQLAAEYGGTAGQGLGRVQNLHGKMLP